MKRILAAIACLLVLCMAGGALAETTLRMAVGYNNAKTGLVFDAETAGAHILQDRFYFSMHRHPPCAKEAVSHEYYTRAAALSN